MAKNQAIQIEFKHIYRPTINLGDMEKAWISLALTHHKNNIQATAQSLGISRATLYRKIGDMNGHGANKKSDN